MPTPVATASLQPAPSASTPASTPAASATGVSTPVAATRAAPNPPEAAPVTATANPTPAVATSAQAPLPAVAAHTAVVPPAPVANPTTPGAPGASRSGASAAGDVQLTQRVLADLQRQVELMLEVRLREALAPILARAADALVRDAKKELTAAMRDIVSRSIARELGRREDR